MSIEAFMGEFREFKENIANDLNEIKQHLKHQNGAWLEFTKTSAERGVIIKNLQNETTYLRDKVSTKADKSEVQQLQAGATGREKAAIGGSYILQLILEGLRWLRSM